MGQECIPCAVNACVYVCACVCVRVYTCKCKRMWCSTIYLIAHDTIYMVLVNFMFQHMHYSHAALNRLNWNEKCSLANIPSWYKWHLNVACNRIVSNSITVTNNKYKPTYLCDEMCACMQNAECFPLHYVRSNNYMISTIYNQIWKCHQISIIIKTDNLCVNSRRHLSLIVFVYRCFRF